LVRYNFNSYLKLHNNVFDWCNKNNDLVCFDISFLIGLSDLRIFLDTGSCKISPDHFHL